MKRPLGADDDDGGDGHRGRIDKGEDRPTSREPERRPLGADQRGGTRVRAGVGGRERGRAWVGFDSHGRGRGSQDP